MCENAKEARKVNVSDDGIDYSGYPSTKKELLEMRAAGVEIKYYFMGTPCKKGHICLRNSSGACIACKKEYYEVYDVENAERRRELGRKRKRDRIEYYRTDFYKKIQKEYYTKHKEIIAEKRRQRSEEVNKKSRERYDTPKSKVNHSMRRMVSRVFEKISTSKNSNTDEILGYSPRDLMNHLESHFLEGMTWDNHGEWHIDHRISVMEYIRNGCEDPAVINALGNLYPMWASDNFSKGDKNFEEWLNESEENREKYGHFLGLDTD